MYAIIFGVFGLAASLAIIDRHDVSRLIKYALLAISVIACSYGLSEMGM